MPADRDQTERPAAPAPAVRCPACGYALRIVWVHGHGQCAKCGVNVQPCCDGAPCPFPEAGD